MGSGLPDNIPWRIYVDLTAVVINNLSMKNPWIKFLLLIVFMLNSFSGIFADETTDLFEGIVDNYSKIKSIDARITQYISTPGKNKEKYKGRYRIDSAGYFRIDYNYPKGDYDAELYLTEIKI